MRYVREGWPEKQKVENSLQIFYKIKDEISIQNDLLYKLDRIIIPKQQ